MVSVGGLSVTMTTSPATTPVLLLYPLCVRHEMASGKCLTYFVCLAVSAQAEYGYWHAFCSDRSLQYNKSPVEQRRGYTRRGPSLCGRDPEERSYEEGLF